jgi:hypothetical protein
MDGSGQSLLARAVSTGDVAIVAFSTVRMCIRLSVGIGGAGVDGSAAASAGGRTRSGGAGDGDRPRERRGGPAIWSESIGASWRCQGQEVSETDGR